MAKVDQFLEIQDIKGESTDDKFKDQIEIESFTFQVQNRSSGGGSGGMGAGKADFGELSFTKQIDKASPTLWLYCAKLSHIPKAILHVRKAGGDAQEYLTITLQGAVVTHYSVSGHGEGVPQDNFTLAYSKIDIEYKPQKEDGTLGASAKVGYDLKAGKAT